MKELTEVLAEQIQEGIDSLFIKGLDFEAWERGVRRAYPEYAECEIWFSKLTFEMVVRLPEWPNGKPVENINDNMDRIMKEFNRHVYTDMGSGPITRLPSGSYSISSKAKKV